jgi:hypothetical protein
MVLSTSTHELCIAEGAGSPRQSVYDAAAKMISTKAHPAKCTLAYWHKPLFSSGAAHGNDPEVKPLWDALYAANADVVINGHDHHYERFAPQDPTGKLDPQRGIREFAEARTHTAVLRVPYSTARCGKRIRSEF